MKIYRIKYSLGGATFASSKKEKDSISLGVFPDDFILWNGDIFPIYSPLSWKMTLKEDKNISFYQG